LAGEAFHGIEVPLVWDRLDAEQKKDPAAAQLPHEFHQAWINFIKGGAPTADGLPTWSQYDGKTRSTMILNTHSKVEKNPIAAELRLWDGTI
jgi:para-nitrobenzyl esterase